MAVTDPNADQDIGTLDLPIQSAVRMVKATLRVRGLRRFKARLWIGALIIRLGFWVIGMPCEIDANNGEEKP